MLEKNNIWLIVVGYSSLVLATFGMKRRVKNENVSQVSLNETIELHSRIGCNSNDLPNTEIEAISLEISLAMKFSFLLQNILFYNKYIFIYDISNMYTTIFKSTSYDRNK